jgi:hypothetical protein
MQIHTGNKYYPYESVEPQRAAETAGVAARLGDGFFVWLEHDAGPRAAASSAGLWAKGVQDLVRLSPGFSTKKIHTIPAGHCPGPRSKPTEPPSGPPAEGLGGIGKPTHQTAVR